MTTYTAPIEDFLANRDMPISKKLASALIENFGGEKEFLESYPQAGRNIRSGYGHFVFNNKMVSFYHENKKEIKKSMKVLADDYGFESVGDFAWAAAGVKDEWSKDEVVKGVYKSTRKPAEELDSLLVTLYVWQVQLLGSEICNHYDDHLDQASMRRKDDIA